MGLLGRILRKGAVVDRVGEATRPKVGGSTQQALHCRPHDHHVVFVTTTGTPNDTASGRYRH